MSKDTIPVVVDVMPETKPLADIPVACETRPIKVTTIDPNIFDQLHQVGRAELEREMAGGAEVVGQYGAFVVLVLSDGRLRRVGTHNFIEWWGEMSGLDVPWTDLLAEVQGQIPELYRA